MDTIIVYQWIDTMRFGEQDDLYLQRLMNDGQKKNDQTVESG